MHNSSYNDDNDIFGNDNPKIKLNLIGITYNQIESGVYAVILQEVDGERRIPIIIGYTEAQAIECRLMGIEPPRPLTHDLMAHTLSTFGIDVTEVVIRRLKSGVFTADIHMVQDGDHRTIDSRSSDAIALAIRLGAPIYTTQDVMTIAGVTPSGKRPKGAHNTHTLTHTLSHPPAKTPTTEEEIKKAMQVAAEMEDYEEAARLKSLLDDMINSK